MRDYITAQDRIRSICGQELLQAQIDEAIRKRKIKHEKRGVIAYVGIITFWMALGLTILTHLK